MFDLSGSNTRAFAREVLRALARAVGGDLQAAEPARVLRLPGTLNHKYDPPRAVTIEVLEPERRYTSQTLLTALPLLRSEGTSATSGAITPHGPFSLPETINDGHRNDTLYRLARSLKAKGLSASAIAAAVRAENTARCVPPLDDAEVEGLVSHALSQADREDFHAQPYTTDRAPSITGTSDPDRATDAPVDHRPGEPPFERNNPWSHATPAPDFLNADDPELDWLEPRVAALGCVTLASSPRGLGKTHFAQEMAVRHARLGKRVLYVDRDNPRREVRRRLRAWGAADTPTLKVITRESTPPLTDTIAWGQFPYRDYDLVVIDSLGATTEGIGELDTAASSMAIAKLLDLARQIEGPAFVILNNTIKSGAHSRGSGVIEDRIDIAYEVRDATNLSPSGEKDWWMELAPAGVEAWAERASRRKRRDSYRLAFVPSKFRIGEEPDPFVLEIRLAPEPWAVVDVTAGIITTGDTNRTLVYEEVKARRDEIVQALVREVRERAADGKFTTTGQAEKVLRDEGLSQKDARDLLREAKWWPGIIERRHELKGAPKVFREPFDGLPERPPTDSRGEPAQKVSP